MNDSIEHRSTYTPGPWKVYRPSGNRCYGIVTEYEVLPEWANGDESFQKESIVIVETDSGAYPPCLADAHLIAGAPELLEVLKAILAKPYSMHRDEVYRAKAAIRKATEIP